MRVRRVWCKNSTLILGDPSESMSMSHKKDFSDPQIYSVTLLSHKSKSLSLRSTHPDVTLKNYCCSKGHSKIQRNYGDAQLCWQNLFYVPLKPLTFFAQKKSVIGQTIHPSMSHYAVTQVSNASYTLLCHTLSERSPILILLEKFCACASSTNKIVSYQIKRNRIAT